jgi:hypothetical protein
MKTKCILQEGARSLGRSKPTNPEPSKEMVEGLEELMKHLDEFKERDHGQHSQDGEARLCFVDDNEWGEGGSVG